MARKHLTSVLVGMCALFLDYWFFWATPWFTPLVAVALSLAWSTYWLDYFLKNQLERELESKFPEFVRHLVGAVRSGMPMAKAVIYVANTDYGALTPHVKKLARQVEWSIPLHQALQRFAEQTGSHVIKRAVATVIEAEQSGGNIEDVLESVTESLLEIRKIRETRRSSIHGQVVQSYVIFFVFLLTMIVIQNFLIPYLGQVQDTPISALTGASEVAVQASPLPMNQDVIIVYTDFFSFMESLLLWLASFKGIFLMMSMIQGFFAGIVTGKLSEGDLKSGIKHSLVLMTAAFFIITLSQGL